MEKKIFEEALLWLRDADVIAYITGLDHPAPKDLLWFEDQFEQHLAEEENKSLPMDFPALAFEFAPTAYKKGNGGNQEADGEFTIHIAQRKYVDGIEGAASQDDHAKLLEYVDIIIDLFSGHQFPCSAKPYLKQVERDHLNRQLMIDKVTFTWSGRRHRAADAPT
jgi:hypothetical protein